MDCPLKRTLDDLGTKYGAYEVNKEEDGDVMMNVVSAVTGNRMVRQLPLREIILFLWIDP